MIEYVTTSIFDSGADVLVNPVNCVGVMGAGLAKEFKCRFPMMYEIYAECCHNHKIQLGTPQMVWDYPARKYICLFPTKKHWKDKSDLICIEDGLITFDHLLRANLYGWCDVIKNSSFSFPKLGCGLGGLNWENQVKPLFEKYLEQIPNKVYVHV